MRNRILHIVSDEKFIDSAWVDFERVFPNRNIFIIPEKRKNLIFIHKAKVYFINPRLFPYFLPIISILFKGIIFHSLYKNSHLKSLLLIPNFVKITWVSWGFDFYPVFFNSESLFKEKTLNLLKNNLQLHSRIKKKRVNGLIEKVLARLNFISTVIPSEFELLNSNFSVPNSKFISWNYMNLEDDIIKGFDSKTVRGKSILVGHSAAIENNHLDSFDFIVKKDLEFDKIVCPLSYGDPEYAKFVIHRGNELFDESFFPIRDFLPYSEYVRTLLDCEICIFSSLRQIGFANIVLMLFLGSKIILDEESFTYKFFDQLGVKVFHQNSKDLTISPIDLNHTRNVLRSIWGKKNKDERTKYFINQIIR